MKLNNNTDVIFYYNPRGATIGAVGHDFGENVGKHKTLWCSNRHSDYQRAVFGSEMWKRAFVHKQKLIIEITSFYTISRFRLHMSRAYKKGEKTPTAELRMVGATGYTEYVVKIEPNGRYSESKPECL